MKNNQRNIDNIVSKILRETLEKKADEVMEKIKSKSSEARRLVNGIDPMDEMSEGSMCSECGGKMYGRGLHGSENVGLSSENMGGIS